VITSPLMRSGVDHTVLPANHTTPAFTRNSPGAPRLNEQLYHQLMKLTTHLSTP